MNKIIKLILPMSFFWLMKKIYLWIKFREKKIKLQYLSNVAQSNFGLYNVLYPYSLVYESSLGDFTYVGKKTIVSHAQIGKFCSIGPDCKIGMGKHPSKDFVSIHPAFFSPRKQAQISFVDKSFFPEFEQILIGNDVWIGANSMILDGVKVGNGAIIAAGAVVTKDVPDYAVVGGVPAKVIHYRFSTREIDALLKIKWWDKDIKWLKKNYKDFHDIKLFLKADNDKK